MSSTTLPVCPKTGSTSPSLTVHLCLHTAPGNRECAPWTLHEAWGYLEALLASPGFEVLAATRRHAAVLAQTVAEHPDVRGNLAHDLHTAVLMREHGVSRICTRDSDFRRFTFLTVVDPLGESRDRQ